MNFQQEIDSAQNERIKESPIFLRKKESVRWIWWLRHKGLCSYPCSCPLKKVSFEVTTEPGKMDNWLEANVSYKGSVQNFPIKNIDLYH